MNLKHELQIEFEEETKTPSVNSQKEFDIDYVYWLENKTSALRKSMEKKDEEIAQLIKSFQKENENHKIAMDNSFDGYAINLDEKDKQIESIKADAIGFAEWIAKNEWKFEYPYWKKYIPPANGFSDYYSTFPTQELYSKYSASKQPKQ